MRLPGLALLLTLASISVARSEPPSPAQQPTPTPSPFRPRVEGVDVEDTKKGAAALGDSILVKLADGDRDRILNSTESYWLYLNGVALKELPISRGPENNQLRFVLKRTPENKDAWTVLLSKWQDQKFLVEVGPKAGPDTSEAAIKRYLNMEVFPRERAATAIVLAVVVVGGAILLGKRTAMLRDPEPASATAGTPAPDASLKPNERTYSLGRTQMAWWTVMTLLAVLALWAITGSIEKISGSMLTLMGIGAGTFLSAAFIDNPGARQGFKSENILKDLLTEKDGVSLHRFQMLVWTLVVTVAFWTSVVTRLEMPDIDPTLLGLLGISSGTYLGFKAR